MGTIDMHCANGKDIITFLKADSISVCYSLCCSCSSFGGAEGSPETFVSGSLTRNQQSWKVAKQAYCPLGWVRSPPQQEHWSL
mmetsp:Transcript_15491/g.34826  ORF Transcript_15491/g.34826 Transcript_15491/m.34826 type:complete len:83 (+) Transcript_15491:267-515(+)